MPGEDTELFTERVLSLVEQIPRGRVMSYGAIARALGAGGARHVGQVMSTHGDAVPWWRVVRADGSLAAPLAAQALRQWRAEGTPVRTAEGAPRVDVSRATWSPELYE